MAIWKCTFTCAVLSHMWMYIMGYLLTGCDAVQIDFIAPSQPCRTEDRLCNVKCEVISIHGDVTCQFCFCVDPRFYIQWTLPPTDPTTTMPTTTLPPNVVVANNVHYHRISDPCEMSRDRMCPMTLCTEVSSTKTDGTPCTQCLCPETIDSLLIGRQVAWTSSAMRRILLSHQLK